MSERVGTMCFAPGNAALADLLCNLNGMPNRFYIGDRADCISPQQKLRSKQDSEATTTEGPMFRYPLTVSDNEVKTLIAGVKVADGDNTAKMSQARMVSIGTAKQEGR